MKKFLFSFFLLLTAVVGRAEDFEVDGIYYNITSAEELTVAVTRGTNEYVSGVVIPKRVAYGGVTYNVTAIEYSAFSGCSDLTSVSIPNSVTTIGTYAFENCNSLTSVSIPNSVTEIGERAFRYCSSLTSITIPNSVTKIGWLAFSGCSGLESVVVTKGNPIYDSRDNCNAIIETSSNKLIFGCKNTVIPNSITEIGAAAFDGCTGLTSITIPNSVTTIEEFAFYDCTGLISVTIPNSVTEIGQEAFAFCSGLTSITIPNSMTVISLGAFSECSGLTSVSIPNSVTTIEEFAFYDCTGLISVTIPNSVTTIGEAAFGDCPALKDVYCFAENVPSTDYSAFEDVKLFSATLHVPAASLLDYSTTKPWSSFGQIVAIDGGDGIEQLTSEEFTNPAFKNPTVYDLSGQCVSKPRKGIYVINGRKTLVK